MLEQEYNTTKSRKNRRQAKKILVLLLLIGFTATVLITSTYAWFIGLNNVTIQSFNVNVAAGEDLELSLDGTNWSNTLAINPTNIANTYEGNSNHWTGSEGLVPVSSSGNNSNEGRLTLFSKTSLSATEGGYRLLADPIDNAEENKEESDKYITFDFFVRNGKGTTYTSTYNEADDEAIYLTKESAAVANAEGSEDYGVANSIRIAFRQIGRVPSKTSGADTSATAITGITCAADADANVTKLCTDVKTVIWEPNDKAHNSILVNYFNAVCKKKTVSGTAPSTTVTYGDACETLTATSQVKTYTVNSQILSSDNVDIYDGLNGFELPENYKLTECETFTDTEKDLTGSARPTFFKLAPNSVTKIRTYIYLEGQDVDNYDLITKGKSITINFGFTKNQLDLSQFEHPST